MDTSSKIGSSSKQENNVQRKNAKRKNADVGFRAQKKTKMKHGCIICNKAFSTKGNLVQHMDTHVDVGDGDEWTFDCDLCGKRFLQKRYLLRHQTRCSPKKSTEPDAKKSQCCSLCGKIFSRLSHLRRHESHHLKQNSFSCSLCDREFGQQYHLERHFRSDAHLKKQFQQSSSTTKGEKNLSKSDQQNQKSTDDDVQQRPNYRNHKCPFCSKSFPTVWEKQRHWRTVHPYAIRRTVKEGTSPQKQKAKTTFLLKCVRCGVRFDNDLLYQIHLEWHQGKRRHNCDECHFAFARRLELETHKASKHGVGWMFECVDCGDRFGQRSVIDRHLKTRQCVSTNRAEAGQQKNGTRRPSESRNSALRCKYCDAETQGVADYRDHVAEHHFRKVFVKKSTPKTPTSNRKSLYSRNEVGVTSKRNGDQNSNVVQLVVDISPTSKPVHVLRLGPMLPEWLVKIQPSYAMLDVAFDEKGEPLAAGESIVLQLPLLNTVPTKDILSKTILVTYQV